ncbi:hypothetical protein tb265_49120 [Gemmatimonadetes bacterium T265]|nr:hypothetical protein tb265_49120 [Gemmatimonadetes bacterium T265]
MAIADPIARKRQHDTKVAAATVAWANETLALTFGEIGAVVDADERTVRRWRGSEVAPRTRHQASLEALVDLRHLLEQVFETPAAAAAWLETPLRGLGGHTPLARVRRGRLQEVVDVLATMESGAFV